MNERGNKNVPGTPDKFRSLRLPGNIILRGEKNFQRLFKNGISLRGSCFDLKYIVIPSPDESAFREHSESGKMKAEPEDEAECKIGFIVGKRLGNAVKRNRLRRQIKEAYRHNRDQVPCQPVWHAAFIAKKIEIPYAAVHAECVSLLTQFRQRLQTYKSGTE